MLRAFTLQSSRILSQNVVNTNKFAALATMQQFRWFSAEGSKLSGSVKWFDPKKGFGFIVPADGEADVFVHQTAIHADGFRSLAEGEEVEYELNVENNGRQSAANVTGPNGDYVQGAPPPRNSFDDNSYNGY